MGRDSRPSSGKIGPNGWKERGFCENRKKISLHLNYNLYQIALKLILQGKWAKIYV